MQLNQRIPNRQASKKTLLFNYVKTNLHFKCTSA